MVGAAPGQPSLSVTWSEGSVVALSRTVAHTEAFASHDSANAATTSSFTPPSNSLLVVAVYATERSGTTDPSGDITVAGGSLTYTQRLTVGDANSWSRGVAIFTAPVGSAASMTITLDCGARQIWAYYVVVLAYEGYDTGSPVGATAEDGADPWLDGSGSITLSANPAADSEVVAVAGIDHADQTDGGVTHGTGWTEVYDSGVDWQEFQAQVRTGSTSTSVGWDDVIVTGGPAERLIVGAIEIKAAAEMSVALGIASEVDEALSLGRLKAKIIGIATESDQAMPITPVKSLSLGIASETDAAISFGRAKAKFIGISSETDTSQPITQPGGVAITAATESDSAMNIGRLKSKAITRAEETDAAFNIVPSVPSVGGATETYRSLGAGNAIRK